MVPSKFLIDGIDRLGKSSLIQRINDDLGYHLAIHYDKPPVLDTYYQMAIALKEAGQGVDTNPADGYTDDLLNLSNENLAKFLYQEELNDNMFRLIATEKLPLIFDRTHLGEMVYAPLYRGYDGNYIYDIERRHLSNMSNESDVRLILLTTSNFDMLVDDGLGFDFSKKEEEQARFINAFNKSQIKNKVIVDVHNGQGGYKSYIEVFEEAINENIS
jgi:hypothetical protein